METEMISALDDIEPSLEERLIPSAAFTPPALADSQYKQLELLQHLSLYSELVIFLSAESGMGKSFIAQALLASRESPDQSLLLEADFSLSYFDILHKLAEFFDLAEPSADLQDFENQVVSHCNQLADDEQGSMLLIIDKADQLADETLEDLNNLALLAPNVLHLMLLAVPSFEEKLISLTEPQAPLHVMELDALQPEEAEILLLQAFPDKDWSAEELNYIVQQGVGNPGKILYIAQQFILGNKPSPQKTAVTKFPITHIAAMLLIACALVVSYFYQSNPNEIETESITPHLVSNVIEADNRVPLQSESDIIEPSNDEALEMDIQAVVTDTSGVDEVDFNFTDSDGYESKASSDNEVAVVESKVEALESDEDNTLKKAPPSSDSKPGLASQKVEENVILLDKPIYSAEEALLLAADKNSYIIQLFGSYSEKSAKIFAKTYSSKSTPLIIYQTLHKSKPWHVVIAGPYKNRNFAQGQLKYFPQKIRKQNPWVRPIKDVKESIKAAK